MSVSPAILLRPAPEPRASVMMCGSPLRIFDEISVPKGIVPEEPLTIAQRFSVGSDGPVGISPEGTAEYVNKPVLARRFSTVPSGLIQSVCRHPTLKRWAILARSLRDPEQFAGNFFNAEFLGPLPLSHPNSLQKLVVTMEHNHPDNLFTAEQQERLQQLMARWRHARDAGTSLSPEEQAELNVLVEAELRAASQQPPAS